MKKSPWVVLAILKAKEGKETELKKLLTDIINPSRSESTCLQYHLHQDINNPAQFFLYEHWTSKDDHALQFSKNYIKNLVEKAETLLKEPYQVIFGNEIEP